MTHHKHSFVKYHRNRICMSWIIIFLLVISCADEKSDTLQTVPDPAHNSQLSLDWWGVYTGVLPCADCEGIDTKLILFDDGTYQKNSRYLGKEDELLIQNEGSFKWTEDGSTIKLDIENVPVSYQVGEIRLTRLDENGEVITGEIASRYMLYKQYPDDSIENIKWKPIEFLGKIVSEDYQYKTPPWVTFSFQNQRVHGNSGCNTFFSNYTRDNHELQTGNIASTMMACTPEIMELEQLFHGVLNKTTSWESSEDYLFLKNRENDIIARFIKSDIE